MRKWYDVTNVGGRVYTEVYSDRKGVLVQWEDRDDARSWVSNYTIENLYVEIIPEKWIVLKEGSDGHFTCDCKAFSSKLEAECWIRNQQNALGMVSTSDYVKGKYVFKVVKV